MGLKEQSQRKDEKVGPEGNIKELKDYTQIEGELYRRLAGSIHRIPGSRDPTN